MLKVAIDTNGEPYNGGKGYKENVRIGSSGTESSATGWYVTGFIPANMGDILRFKNCNYFDPSAPSIPRNSVSTYDSSFTLLNQGGFKNSADDYTAAWACITDEDGGFDPVYYSYSLDCWCHLCPHLFC